MSHDMKVADTLNRAAELVERGWCQGDYAQDNQGECVGTDSEGATCWCSVGSIVKSVGNNGTAPWDNVEACCEAVCKVLGLERASCWRNALIAWNDVTFRRQEEVVAALRDAAASVAGEVQVP